MARKGVTFEQVAKAAEQLLLSNINPKNGNVRELLGTGSNTTIAKHLRDWRMARLHDGIDNVPRAMNPAELNLSELHGRFEQEKLKAVNQLTEKADALSRANTELTLKNECLKTERGLLKEQYGTQFVASLKLKNENRSLVQQQAALVERVAQMEDRLTLDYTRTEKLAMQLEMQTKSQAEQYESSLTSIEEHYKARLSQAMTMQEEYRTLRMVEVDALQTENIKLREKVLTLERQYAALPISKDRSHD